MFMFQMTDTSGPSIAQNALYFSDIVRDFWSSSLYMITVERKRGQAFMQIHVKMVYRILYGCSLHSAPNNNNNTIIIN